MKIASIFQMIGMKNFSKNDKNSPNSPIIINNYYNKIYTHKGYESYQLFIKTSINILLHNNILYTYSYKFINTMLVDF
jgi:hypothetical protein